MWISARLKHAVVAPWDKENMVTYGDQRRARNSPCNRLVLLQSITLCTLFATTLGAVSVPVRARRAMVVSAEAHATRIGVRVLKDGGNAVDAAVAVGFALAVTHPRAGNLGGGGFMLIRMADGSSTFLDFRERAPTKANRDMYLDEHSQATNESFVGYRAVGVPGTVRGLAAARSKYGTRPWAELLAPALELAHNGFPISDELARDLAESARLPLFPESKRVFQQGGRPLKPGQTLRQNDLAKTITRLRSDGPDEFYTGQTARMIAEDMKRHGGLVTLADLKAYKPVERQPLEGTYRGYGILSAPPPSSGGIGIIQMLNMLEGSGFAQSGPGSASATHYVVEVMRHFFADRAQFLGDTDFVEVPTAMLIGKKYARARRASIDPSRVTISSQVFAGRTAGLEAAETTHYSIVDLTGNAVAVTYTLNGSFGSGVTALGTGVLLNNEMDDFTTKPGVPNFFGLLQSERNAIEPGKRPLSAMTPTIMTRDGKPFLVLGAAGGPRIISVVLQVITNVIDFRMNIQEAVDFPRFHHQWMPDELTLENFRFSPDVIALLRERGHKIVFVDRIARTMAIESDGEWLYGTPDSRSEGRAAGY